MSCRCRCVASSGPVNVLDTPTIDLSGDGSGAFPLLGDVIVPPTVIHPLLLSVLANGLDATAAGLEVQPDRQFGITGPFGTGVGFVPTIVADTAPGPHTLGMIDWGPTTLAAGVNQDANRTTLFNRIETLPLIIATLEPGASISVGHSLNFPAFDFADWTLVNTGPLIGTWRLWLPQRQGIGGSAAAGVGNAGPVETFRLSVRASGFLGASSVATLFGAKMQIAYLGLPV